MVDLHYFYSEVAGPEYEIGDFTFGLKGLYVASLTENGHWARALVLNYVTVDTVKVRFIDAGHQHNVRCANIRFLHREFAEFPAQAFATKICAVVPPPANGNAETKSKRDKAHSFMKSWMSSARYNVFMVLPKKKKSYGLNIPRSQPFQAVFIDTTSDANDGNGKILNQDLIDGGFVGVDPSFVDRDGSFPWHTMIRKAEAIAECQRQEAELKAVAEAATRAREEALNLQVESWLASAHI